MPKVSAILITKNEEANLSRCLNTLKWADEIILLDSGSTDRTLEIARQYHAKIFSEDWKGYTAQKNSALQKTQNDWVVSLDADEEFSPQALEDIQHFLSLPTPEFQAYSFRRKVFYLGKWIHHGDWYPDHVIRLWNKKAGKYQGGRVHESVQIEGKIHFFKSDILHYTYQDLEDQKARLHKYANLWAHDQYDRGRKFRSLDLFLRPPARFLRALVLKFGWLDGWRGWIIAWMSAREVRLKYENLRKLQQHPPSTSL